VEKRFAERGLRSDSAGGFVRLGISVELLDHVVAVAVRVLEGAVSGDVSFRRGLSMDGVAGRASGVGLCRRYTGALCGLRDMML
jgi:hypothetical protein